MAPLLIASAVVLLIALMCRLEWRLRRAEASSAHIDAPVIEPPVIEVVVAPLAPEPLSIVSSRARCTCSHALERHALCASGRDCGCRAFRYSGGLVEPASTGAPRLRLSA